MSKTFALEPLHSAPMIRRKACSCPSAVAARVAARRGAAEPARTFTASSRPGCRRPISGFTRPAAALPVSCRSSVLRRAHVTVVDIDEDQIRNNDYAQETILGDIQTHRFASDSFDLVICYNVIEHVPDVEAALLGFCGSLKQDGMILIGAPNPRSLSGVVTKYSPHWFHVWFYRHIRGDKNAGQPGCAPFPTHFHPLVSLQLEAFAQKHGLQRSTASGMRARAIRRCGGESRFRGPDRRRCEGDEFFLPGRTDVRHGDYHVILRKR